MQTLENTFNEINGVYYINKPYDEYLLITNAKKIVVSEGLNVKLIDNNIESDLEIEIKQDAYVKYLSIETSKSNIIVNNSGELEYVRISLLENDSNFTINLNKENAYLNAKLLSIAKRTKQNFHQLVNHNKPNTTSVISNFGVALDNAQISFDTTGKIYNKMSKSKCSQLSKGIIMDDDSKITSLPILLIDEYDVEANHGASIGKMSDDDLFYLMSRGLNKTEAFLLMLEGIVNPFIQAIENEDLKKKALDNISTMIGR
jgi:Fe-S cluster assembly protein SufD